MTQPVERQLFYYDILTYISDFIHGNALPGFIMPRSIGVYLFKIV